MRTVLLFLLLSIAAQAGLVHYYNFQGNVNDQAGTADGTLLNGASASAGVLTLDGTDDYVQFGGHIVPTSGIWSVVLKAQSTSISGIQELISQGTSGGPGFFMGTQGTTGMRLSDAWGSVPEDFIQDANFHQYALVMDTTEARFYIDGVLKQTHATFTTTPDGDDTRLGSQFNSYGEYFSGKLSDVRIYDHAVSENEMTNDVNSTPEPSTLLAVPLAALAFLARRRRSA